MLIRKLELLGNVCGREERVSSYYSWPLGKEKNEVDEIVRGFCRAFCNPIMYIESL
jgi:hypothetical protein